MTELKHLENRRELLQKYLKIIDKEICNEPNDNIRIQKRNKSAVFYIVPYGKNNKATYLSKKNKALISVYCQKRYNHSVYKDIKKQLAIIENFLLNYNENIIKDKYYSINEECFNYVKPLELPNEVFFKLWKDKSYQGNKYEFNNSGFITSNGEQVRSKSELIIANCLKDMGIPYKYEYPFHLSNVHTIYPDFTVLNIKTCEEIVWEHFGRMDSEEYRTKTFNKLNLYSSVGYFPGNGLITTFEDFKNPLDVSYLKEIIKNYLM